MALKVTDIDNTLLEKCYKYIHKCSVCKKRYGTDKEEKSRHLCPIHDLNFKDNRFKEAFAEKLYDKSALKRLGIKQESKR